jgi:threonylcarbamoyladenosine tRNA methylthiotransferase MtaB
MPQMPRELIKARAARLRDAASERRAHWLGGLVGTTQRVLIEGGGKGHADNFAPVLVAGAQRGDLMDVRITGCEAGHAVGSPA